MWMRSPDVFWNFMQVFGSSYCNYHGFKLSFDANKNSQFDSKKNSQFENNLFSWNWKFFIENTVDKVKKEAKIVEWDL